MKKMVFAAAMLIGSFSQATQLGLLGANFNAPTVNDKDNVFQPAVGEIVYDSSDSRFWGYRDVGGWAPLGASASEVMPVGSILTFAGATCPSGYLPADGASYGTTGDTEALFTAIGYAHGGAGAVFNVPDYRGRFLRGANGEATRDPNASTRTAMATGGNSGNNVGSVQSDALQNITGQWESGSQVNGAGAFVTNDSGNGNSGSSDGYWNRGIVTFDASRVVRTSTETRPQNAYVNYCIKK